jgi:hypothetical protein
VPSSWISAYACAFSLDGCFIWVTGTLHEFPTTALVRL